MPFYNVYVKPEGRRSLGQVSQVSPEVGETPEAACRRCLGRPGDRPAGNKDACVYENDEVVCELS